MSLVHACAFADWRLNEGVGNAGQIPPPPGSIQVRPYLVKKVMAPPADNRPREELLIGHDFAFARQFYDNSDIIIRFGRHNPSFTNENGNVEPTCGEIRVKVVDLGDATLPITQGGAYAMQVFYFNLIKSLWFTNLAPGSPEQGLVWLSQREAELHMSPDRGLRCMLGCVSYIGLPACSGPVPYPCEKQHPSALSRQIIIDDIQANQVNVAVNTAWQNFNNNNTGIVLIPEVRNYGWAGAGVWYNTINKVNGAFITAVYGMPAPTQYPKIMQEVKQKRSAQDSTITGPDQFCLNQSGGREIKLTNGDTAKQMAEVMCNVNKYWADSTANQGAKQESITKNAIEDVMHIILGTGGLFAMRDNNAAVHPMAQLAGVGKSLVDSAVLNIAVSTGFSLGGGLMGLVDKQGQKIGDIISRLGNGIAFMGLTAGFVLFYILPFLPFLYFLFAVGSWVKTIFEAMVGIPLWALAHLRIDGDGLPGDAAANGYFLIFEIFIRPILTVFGLIAAITIFTAQVRVLNFIWDLVVSNITGYDADPVVNVLNLATVPRGVVDQFFFTIIYTIIVYMLATASFKLIDKLPDNILRWMGAGVSSFGDINEDPTQSLTRYAALGGMTIGKQATEGLQQFSGAVGKGIADEAQKGEKILGELSNMTNMLKKP